VKWHGVAMVEFKVTADGRPYLMKSIPLLGVSSTGHRGWVDFPFLLYQLAMGERLEQPTVIDRHQSRWLLGDLDHLYLTFKNHSGQGLKTVSKWRASQRSSEFL
jgi:hypothetical protein